MLQILTIYILSLLALGYYLQNKIETLDDYILGGRSVPWYLVAGSLAATDIGAGASLGLIQSSTTSGNFSSAMYIWLMVPSYMIGSLIVPMVRKTSCRTIPDFFRMKYGKIGQTLSAILMIAPNIGIISINITAASALLQVVLQVEFFIAVLLTTLISLIYSYLGGILADIITDAIQIVAVIIGFTSVAYFLWLDSSFSFNIVSKENVLGNFSTIKIASLLVLYVATFVIGLSTSSRIYSSKNPNHARNGVLTCIPLYFIYALIPALIGYFLHQNNIPGANLDQIISAIETRVPFPYLAILFIGIVSASLSTTDTLLIGCATILYNDIYKNLLPNVDLQSNQIRVTKIILIGLGLFSFIVSIIGIDDIIQFLIFLLSVQTCSLLVPYFLGHMFNKPAKYSELFTIIFTCLLFLLISEHDLGYIYSLIFSLVFFVAYNLVALHMSKFISNKMQ